MSKPDKKRLNLTNIQRKYLFKMLGISSIEEIDIAILKLLKERLKSVTDKRQQHKIFYKIWDIIIYVIVANFSNVYDWEDIEIFVKSKYSWFKNFLQMTGGIPSAQTIERVFSLIDSKELENILTSFFLEIIHVNDNKNDIINIDGRVSRGSKRNETCYNNKINPLNVLNAYSNKYGICLSSEQIDEKTNEIPSIPIILENLNIENTIVTWDALNTQKENVKSVTSKNGFYVVPVKANHQTFSEDLKLYFNDEKLETIIAGNSNSAYLKHIEKNHSSIIKYEYFQTTDIDWYYDKESWSQLNSIGLVRKTITINDEEKIEYRFYISNLYLDIENFSNAIRIHWSVENKLHWHLDFTFKEDKNLTANKQALMNLQIVNKFTLAVLSKVKPFYNGLSLKKIRTLITCDFEKNFVNLLCYLLCS